MFSSSAIPTTIEAKVEVHEKVGDGLNAYMTYKVSSTSDIDAFQGRQYESIRRFKDFEWLHEKLSAVYQYLIIPPLPEKHVASTGKMSKEFIETRCKELDRFLKKVVSHPRLIDSTDLHLFLQAKGENWNVTKAQTSIISSKLGRAWTSGFSSLVDTVMGTPKDPDPYFEEEKQNATKMNKSLDRVSKTSQALSEKQTELVASLTELGHGARMLASAEVDTALSPVMVKFASVAETASETVKEQALSELQLMSDPMLYYSRVANSAKTTLGNRSTLLSQLESANRTTQDKQEKYEKLKATQKRDSKFTTAEKELAEATSKSEGLQCDFNTASSTIRGELQRSEEERVSELRQSLIRYIEQQIEYESKLASMWTELAQEIRPKEIVVTTETQSTSDL